MLTLGTGKILDVGADWGLVDPRTGIFSADTRYNFRTDDGEDIFLQTSGPKTESGDLHLRIVMETGSEKYYWVNNIVGMSFTSTCFFRRLGTYKSAAIGILTNVEKSDNFSMLRINAWNVSSLLGIEGVHC